ncbi:putative S-layer protein [Candidatus Woesearchaeota archaeon]|nr:putative S-layer protein [Candidatus Woesearchaeota archaeon]MBT4248193.1 putative S-layer protein [Candidatus Woesearchaeota archaeon]
MKKLLTVFTILCAALFLIQGASALDADVTLNEFVANPAIGGNEWIELHNSGATQITLTGWTITDSLDQPFGILDGKTISAGGFLAIEHTTDLLNNNVDSITLKNNNAATPHEQTISYGAGATDYDGVPTQGKSVARLNNKHADNAWEEFNVPTREMSNSPVVSFATGSVADAAVVTTSTFTVKLAVAGGSNLVAGYLSDVSGASCDFVLNKGFLEHTCSDYADGATITYSATVKDDHNQVNTVGPRTVTVNKAKSFAITPSLSAVSLGTENVVAVTTITITNDGEVDVELNTADFSMSNLIFEHLDSSTSYVYESELDEYKLGMYIDTSAIHWSFPSELNTHTLGTTDTTRTVVLTGTTIIPQENLPEYYGKYAGTLSIAGTPTGATEKTVKTSEVRVSVNPEGYNHRSKLSMKDIDFDDDDPYFRTEEFEVTVTLENKYSEKVKSIELNLEIPELDIEESSSKFSLSDKGDENEVTFTFDIDDRADEGEYPMLFYLTAETETSAGTKIDIAEYNVAEKLIVSVDDDDLIVESIKLDDTQYRAGDDFTVRVNVLNIGDDEQEDTRVRVKCTDFDITQMSEVYDRDLKANKDNVFTFSLEIPTFAKDGEYFCSADIMYDGYTSQEDDDDTSEHLTKEFVIVVAGGLGSGEAPQGDGTAIITGTSAGAAIPGSATKFTLQLKNNDVSGSATYKLLMEDYSSWASSKVEPAELTIPAGTSVPFYAYLTPNEGVTGTKTATVAIYVGGEQVAEKTLTVTINSDANGGIQVNPISGITGSFAGPLDLPTAIVISSIVAGIVILGAIYMVTIGKKL